MKSFDDNEFVWILRKEFNRRLKNNPRYSIRSFAVFLNIDQSALSKVLAGKSLFSVSSMKKCLTRLNFSEHEIKGLIQNITAKKTLLPEVPVEFYEIVQDWQSLAIFEILRLNPLTEEQIAMKLSIPLKKVGGTLEMLKKSGFVRKREALYLITSKSMSWKFPKQGHIELQSSLINKAIDAVEKVPFDLRENCSITLAVNSLNMDFYKKIITEAEYKINRLMNKSSKTPDEVYVFNISLFPLSKS